jgi:hypothetical protein
VSRPLHSRRPRHFRLQLIPDAMRHVSRLWLCLFLGLDASGTRWLPPTLPELVAGSDHIGIVEIRESEAYDVTDDEGAIP